MPTESTRLYGLPPIVDSRTQLLVLGSFPSVTSLARQQYYAHPQNQFWKILQAIWPSSPSLISVDSYEKRSQWLLDHGLGVWDVYASCERQGSLDAAIRKPEVNDFARLLASCPQLRAIAHNGGESFRHARHVIHGLSPLRASHVALMGAVDAEAADQLVGSIDTVLPVYKLPSTSPANASWGFERKLEAWRAVVAAAGLL